MTDDSNSGHTLPVSARPDGPSRRQRTGSEVGDRCASNTYDAIIIGGGHNGLTSGAYFARDGARTVVLEARDKTGGAADTSAPFPDHPEINVTTYSYVMSLMPPTIIRELNLKRHGYDVTPFGPYFQAFPDGRAITVYADDAKKSYDSIAQFSKKDADTLPKWEAWLKGVADVLGPLLLQRAAERGLHQARRPDRRSAQTAWKMRKLGQRGVADVTRLFTMSVTDLLDDWFESDAIKAMLTVNGVIGTWAGPDEPGTAYVMLHHSIGDVGDGHLGSWGFQQGGMGAVSDSIRRSAESFGGEIRTDAKVQKILTRGGRAVGVALENGEELRAPVVVSCDPPEDRVPRPDRPARAAGRLRLGHRAVEDALGRREDQRGDLASCRTSRRSRARTSRTTTPGRWSCASARSTPSARSRTRTSSARPRPRRSSTARSRPRSTSSSRPRACTCSRCSRQWVPDDWNTEPHRDELDAYAERIIDGYTKLAPNFKGSIIDCQVIGPYDMEQELGLIGGNIFHGELSVDQLFHMRPAPGYADFRTPIKGLYHGSCATHGGGGVNGIPGWQAFKMAEKDKAVAKK